MLPSFRPLPELPSPEILRHQPALAHLVARGLYNQGAALAERGDIKAGQATLVEAIKYDMMAFSPDYEGFVAHRTAWLPQPEIELTEGEE